jgi:hypothetical protein
VAEPERLVLGEALPLDLTATATGGATAPDFSTTPVTVVIDSFPSDPDDYPVRVVLRWRPGGTSDSQFSYDAGNAVLNLDLPSSWTADNMTAGRWKAYWLVGEPSVQDCVKVVSLFVEEPPGGALPTEDPA